jgi:hypothetical protein
MKRDPVYRQIIEGLEGSLDPDLFEECVADLLRNIYPTLVPIHGGKDAGMDGAIADTKGEPFPLITTTSENAIRNLTKNLNSYLKDGRKRRRFIFATSRYLTSRKIRNLEKRANQLGFTLIQTYHQRAIADLLYHSPEWCLELLGLTGRPPALSVIPKAKRPLLNQELVAREADLLWLRRTQGDRLLVGQPGSGKTFLLYKFALEGGGLFVVDGDRGQIANGIRSEKPAVLIVDDAHNQLELLLDLKQIRHDIGASFSILATCWPGDQEGIKQALNLSQPQIHELNLLTRPEIVRIVNGIGIHGPNHLIREILDQAEGRPGLAVTLAYICLQGGVQEVVLGDALSSSVRSYFEPIIGSRAIDILACFSVGGNAGMSKELVAKELGLSLLEIRETAVKLAAGGIIWETNTRNLAVYPESLRHALVRDVFFQNALSLPIEPFIEESPDLEQTARTLIGAYWRGAKIRQDFLVGLLEKANSAEAWTDYAWQGRKEAAWVLDRHPSLLTVVISPALHHVPKIVLPMMFEVAMGDDRLLHATPEHPFRQIQDWVHAGYPGTGEAIQRRRNLIQVAKSWLDEDKDTKAGLMAIRIAFSPLYEGTDTDPGSENTLHITQGYILPEEMEAIHKDWETVFNSISKVHQIEWEPLKELAREWAFPGVLDVNLSDETYILMRSFAERLLRDVCELGSDHPGILHWAQRMALDAGLNVDVRIDPEFETLYPIEDRQNWSAAEAEQRPEVVKLAEEWSGSPPEIVVKKIVKIEREAVTTDLHWPRWTPFLCSELANRSEDPIAWSRAFIESGLSGDLIEPFLKRAAESGFPGWKEPLFESLKRADIRWMAISITLTLESPPEDLLKQVFPRLSGYAELVRVLCARKEISEDVVKKLLQYEDPNIAGAAAYGEWYADPKGQVRLHLVDDWRNAVVRTRIDHFLSGVLQDDTELAYGWLLSLLGDESISMRSFDRSIPVAVKALDFESKKKLLETLADDYTYGELVSHLVGNDLNLYNELLDNKKLQDLHLVPLVWHEGSEWVEKAKLALDKGYSTEDIVSACYGFPMKVVTWWGPESARRKEWVDRFSELFSNPDERIRKIGEIGKAGAELALQRALEQERLEIIYGWDRARRNRQRLS